MSIFNFLFRSNSGHGAQPNSLSAPIATTTDMLNDVLWPLNTNLFRRYGLKCQSDVAMALDRCSVLWAIISQKAFQFTKGEVVIWNPATKKPLRGKYKEWLALFRQPNKQSTQRSFFIEAYSYMQAYGFCVIEPIYPVGFSDRPSELWVIPNNELEWDQYTMGLRDYPKKVRWTTNGQSREIDVSTLIIVKDPASVEKDPVTHLPLPRISNLEQEISNIIASLESSGAMITDRGAMGIVAGAASKDAFGVVAPMDKPEKERLQALMRGYGTMNNQNKVILTNSPLSYTPITFDAQQLELSSTAIAGIKAICNRLAFPFTMLAEGFEGKYNNSTTARRDFQDTTIDPESMDFFEQLSMGLKMYSDDAEIYMDYSGVASVQASEQEKGTGRKAMADAEQIMWDMGLRTRNQILEDLGFDPVSDKPEEFEKYKFETATANTNNGEQQQQDANGQ